MKTQSNRTSKIHTIVEVGPILHPVAWANDESQPFIVMELLEGETLREASQEEDSGKVPWNSRSKLIWPFRSAKDWRLLISKASSIETSNP
jgi:hypothetical protein